MTTNAERDGQVHDLEQLLARIGHAEHEHEEVSLGTIMAHVGHRSFRPFCC